MNLGQLLESPLATRLIGARQVNVDWDQLAVTGARLLTDAQIWRLFELAVSDLSIALCLHQVSRRSRDELTIPVQELDAFIERASSIPHTGGPPWLTVSFDDGYEDAWHYVVTRAPRFPSVEWLMFVCPTKTEQQTGFRWDLDVDDDSERDPKIENGRADLKSVVHLSDAHLATVEQCRYITLFENAHLGNHTNCHFRAMTMPPAQAEEEIAQSRADFERLFGPERHFAFPFGGRGIDFDERHVQAIRRDSKAVIWTTVARPHLAAHRYPGAVLPRFGVDGRWSPSQIAFWIAMRSLRARAKGLEPLCAPPPAPLDTRRSLA